jgi:branched-chain amino acid transport system permease protein
MRALIRSRLSAVIVIFLVVALILPFWVGTYVLGVLTAAYYFGVFAMSWDLLFGYAGEVNFGPTFLIGLGAYTAGIVDSRYGWPIGWCVAAGTAAAVVGGVALALPALRLRGPYFGLVTLVAVLLLESFVVVMSDLTGGEIGLTVPDVISVVPRTNYFIALAVMTLVGILLTALVRSPFGLILEAIGQDPIEASALGFNVSKHKLAAFVVSAFFSGSAGAFLVFYLGTASVGSLIDISVGAQVVIGAVLGGRRSIVGGVLGAIFLITAGELLRPLGTLSTFVVSLVALIFIMLVPSGMLGALLYRRDRT